MLTLTQDYIKNNIADSSLIFNRGKKIYKYGAYICQDAKFETGNFEYEVDGSYDDYTIDVKISDNAIESSCNCPYPGDGCKHIVASLLDISEQIKIWKTKESIIDIIAQDKADFLTLDEIKAQAIDDRKKRAKNDQFEITFDEMYKGVHLLKTPKGICYDITLHDPLKNVGHCSCPDYLTNRLGTCKHLIFLGNELKKIKKIEKKVKKEIFPFIDIYWDSILGSPKLFCELPEKKIKDIAPLILQYFNGDGKYIKNDISELITLINELSSDKRVYFQESVLSKVDNSLNKKQLLKLQEQKFPSLDFLKTKLYPYQIDGVKAGLYKQSLLIGDEMGLGKTLQAIALGILKKQVFDFNKILVVTLASLKEQWKREIEKFTDEKATVIEGSSLNRQKIYKSDNNLFKLTNYEAVLRDVTIISNFKPDLIILDEAQRIKNFNTKTSDAVKSIPKKHSLILTGTPLENKLEDIYSIIQFLDPNMFSPLWMFAADYFMLSRNKKGKILGYRNLETLHERLKAIVVRRKKQEVISELPDEIVNNYYIELTDEQLKIHAGYLQSLLPILNKKFLTPMDLRRMQTLMLCMRMVCDSTYLIDRKTNISPKLKELESILDELVICNNHKVVIFSEWTTMTFLIAKHLSEAGIKFVELTGKVPVKKRQALIDEFTNNSECKVFLSTDAGGTGLNLQAGDCVINFELPWNPAKMNQRIGRVNRIGQKSKCINVVNLISKNSIEEKILTGIQLKTDLFKGVFDGGTDQVEFSQEKRTELLNRLRSMMGEEPLPEKSELKVPEEIPEDTPHFLNPKVLKDQEEKIGEYTALEKIESEQVELKEITPKELAYDQEEKSFESFEKNSENIEKKNASNKNDKFSLSTQPPEKVEEVLNSGMQFISGLFEMATGQKVEKIDDNKMVEIDRKTGEVTMKFKLPVF